MTVDDKPNAPMTPREYVDAIVLPTLHEALGARDDRRRAYLACLVVCHVADSIGFAEATAVPGFLAMRGRPRKDLIDHAVDAAKKAARARCGETFDIVLGFANGLKHPSRLPVRPGSEEVVPVFAFDTPGAGFGQGRWGFPGLAVRGGVEGLYLDACAQQVLAAFVCAYPTYLGGIALSFLDWGLIPPGLDLRPEWLKWISTWARMSPAVEEVWLIGSRANGTSTAESDIGLAVVLATGEPGRSWTSEEDTALVVRWQGDLASSLGHGVSLEAFTRDDDEGGAPPARAGAILLWRRRNAAWGPPRPNDGEPG